jgi:radical SAM protein with 4Fe4S-binding SPASM domain
MTVQTHERGLSMLNSTGEPDQILKTYLQSKTLSVLANRLPLATPFTVGIDPSNRCNFACQFCPTGHPDLLKKIGRPTGRMEFELFKRIIDGMNGFPDKVKRLYLYHEGEPLLNPRLPDMLAYARRADVAEQVQTTSNGALLTPKVADALLDADFDLIRISVEHVNDDGYHHLTGTRTRYEQIRRNVEYLFNERERRGSRLRIHPKIMDTHLTSEQKEKFVRDFQPIGDLLNIQKLGDMPASEGVDFTLGTKPEFGSTGAPFKPDRIVCPHPFYVMVVKWRGEVVTCSEEWRWENIVGDTKLQTLPEIWNSEPLRKFRLTHLQGNRNSINHCHHCPSVCAFAAENDLDDVREELLQVYSRPLAGQK